MQHQNITKSRPQKRKKTLIQPMQKKQKEKSKVCIKQQHQNKENTIDQAESISPNTTEI